jgi:hypothetical protein
MNSQIVSPSEHVVITNTVNFLENYAIDSISNIKKLSKRYSNNIIKCSTELEVLTERSRYLDLLSPTIIGGASVVDTKAEVVSSISDIKHKLISISDNIANDISIIKEDLANTENISNVENITEEYSEILSTQNPDTWKNSFEYISSKLIQISQEELDNLIYLQKGIPLLDKANAERLKDIIKYKINNLIKLDNKIVKKLGELDNYLKYIYINESSDNILFYIKGIFTSILAELYYIFVSRELEIYGTTIMFSTLTLNIMTLALSNIASQSTDGVIHWTHMVNVAGTMTEIYDTISFSDIIQNVRQSGIDFISLILTPGLAIGAGISYILNRNNYINPVIYTEREFPLSYTYAALI